MSTISRVFKYGPLEIGHVSEVAMPYGARLLHFGAQQGQQLWVWAEVNPDNGPRVRRLLVVGTGHLKPEGGEHVGSWVSDEYVWHLFDFGAR